MNTLKHSSHRLSPYEVFKNRTITELDPLKFHPTNMELKMKQEKFNSKIEKIAKSGLKIRLPVYRRDEIVKVIIPDAEISPNFGKVCSYKDFAFATSVRMSLQDKNGNYGKPIAVNKNYICIPQNQTVVQPET